MEVVDQLRRARVAAVLESCHGNLQSVLNSAPDSYVAKVYVVKLLDVAPLFGKVAGRRLMAELEILPLSRICDLTDEQRRALVSAVTKPQ